VYFKGFREFLKLYQCEENLRFWSDAEKYRQINTNRKRELEDSFKIIYDTYVRVGSSTEINISSEVRKEIHELYYAGTLRGFAAILNSDSLFNAQQYILDAVNESILPNFYLSEIYKECKKEIEANYNKKGIDFDHLPTIDFLLNNPVGMHYFHRFLQMQFMAENIYFWIAIERFRNLDFEVHSAQLEAQQIWSKFLDIDAPQEVNVDAEVRLQIKQCIDARVVDISIFVTAQQIVFAMLKGDQHPRFLESNFCKELLERWKNKKPLRRPHFAEDKKSKRQTMKFKDITSQFNLK